MDWIHWARIRRESNAVGRIFWLFVDAGAVQECSVARSDRGPIFALPVFVAGSSGKAESSQGAQERGVWYNGSGFGMPCV
jgi:hypothetical protein